MHLPRIAALLFDMDGTLVDSDAAVDRAWLTWCAEFGVDAGHAMAISPGHPAADTVNTLLADRLGPEAVAAAAIANSNCNTTTCPTWSPPRGRTNCSRSSTSSDCRGPW